MKIIVIELQRVVWKKSIQDGGQRKIN